MSTPLTALLANRIAEADARIEAKRVADAAAEVATITHGGILVMHGNRMGVTTSAVLGRGPNQGRIGVQLVGSMYPVLVAPHELVRVR